MLIRLTGASPSCIWPRGSSEIEPRNLESHCFLQDPLLRNTFSRGGQPFAESASSLSGLSLTRT